MENYIEHVLQLLLVLAVIVVASKAAGVMSTRIGQPAVFGELLIGLLLGPSLLNLLHFFPGEAAESLLFIIKDLAQLGVIFLMFLAGLETNLAEMKRVGLAAFNGALGGVLLPFGAGTAISLAFGFPVKESVFIGTVLTATSVSITAQTLLELGKLRSKEGTTILGAAVIDDVMGIIVLSLVVALSSREMAGSSTAGNVVWIVVKMLLFFLVSIAVGQWLLARVTRWVQKLPASEAVFAFAIVVMLLYSWGAEALGGVAAITGAYIAGLLYAQTQFKHFIEERVQITAYGFLVPVFFVSIGLEANARELGGSLLFTGLIVASAILSKIIGTGLGTWLSRFTPLEAIRVGVGMVSRGEVALIVASVGLGYGVIDEAIFSIMVIMTLVTTLVTPVLLRFAFGGGCSG